MLTSPNQDGKIHGYPLVLIKLYAIEKGWLKYLPVSIPAIRDVKNLLEDIFKNRPTEKIAGYEFLFKQDIRAGIHSRVLTAMGYTCIVCNTSHKKNMNIHHIKPYWRTWSNAYGFTTLCQDCHKMLQTGLDINIKDLKELSQEFANPNSPLYDPSGLVYPEPTIVKSPKANYFYLKI